MGSSIGETTLEMNDKSKRFAGVRALIFDLDGTLIDSKLDLALAVNAALSEMGRTELPHGTIYGFVGNGAPMLIQRSLGNDASEAECKRVLEYFIRYYREHALDNTVPYPGVREGLEQLSGMPKAVLTNKPERISKFILEGLGLAPHFRHVYGGNTFERKKPDPIGVQTILRDFGLGSRDVVIVGDSEIDVQTARNAGTWACGVTYGLGSERLAEYPPDLLIDSLTELQDHLNIGAGPDAVS
jgi:phosphoglycolate phosphatase